ncbi:MAG TPA: LamG-like jellyroll fold domain-containing protein [Verrucomicrobiae bacterium]|nr:LamG-like jellyroll fold domain-containing protein [Verrucomicrobiae bacterium]
MQMVPGKAFSIGTSDSSVAVSKSWVTVQSRQFLIEEVPVDAVADDLLALPPATTSKLNPPLHVVSTERRLPPQRLAQSNSKGTFITKAMSPNKGLVLDYNTINTSMTNVTFQGDTTYYISGTVNLYGTNVFEGGAVIKYTNNATIGAISGSSVKINWLASAYRPVIFTAKDDNSVGETISGSTGNPSGYYANPALTLVATTFLPSLANFRISYAYQALTLAGTAPSVFDGQIINCQNGIYVNSILGQLLVENLLFANVQTNFNSMIESSYLTAKNVTFNSSVCLATVQDGITMNMTNCVLANVTNLTNSGVSLNGSHNGFYNSPAFGTSITTNTFYPFQAVGAGNYYLTNGCNFFNAGTTNIDPTLLASLAQKTTYPPIIYSNVIVSNNITLNPQAQRDTDTPDLGYHYDPIDYLVDNYAITNVTLAVTNGVAIASYNEPGIQLQNGSAIISIGSPLYPNWFVRYSSVQEQSVSLGGTNLGSGITVNAYDNGTAWPTGQFVFSKFARPAGGGNLFNDTGANAYSSLLVQNCELWSGPGVFNGNTNTVTTLQNNLFDRSSFTAVSSVPTSLWVSDNLFFRITSVFFWNQASTNTWQAFNNAFDTCGIDNSAGTGLTMGQLTNGYNGYLNCSPAFAPGFLARLSPTNASDIVTNATMSYETGPLGTFYQPSDSPLIDAGSTNANLLGLYHYTTQTNQTVEGTSTVDIGYHYVATDANGNPLDSNGDGIPDYLEDVNGNGIVDGGETNWGLAILTQPVSQTVSQGANVTFSVTAQGVAPLSYQWYFNGTNIPGATNSSSNIASAQVANEGTNWVVVSNITGSITSAPAVLNLTCDTAPSGLVAWWQAESNALDSVGSNNGIVTNGVSYAAGKVGTAFNFDGTNGFIQVPDNPALKPTNLTIEAWIKFSSLNSKTSGGAPAGEQFIIEKPNASYINPYFYEGYLLGKYRNGSVDNFQFTVASNSTEFTAVSTVSIQTNVWYHVAGVHGSNYIQIYVNGQPSSKVTVHFTQNYGTEPLTIGSSGQSWDGKFKGTLDEVSLYNRDLSSNEIATLYAAGTNGFGKCDSPPTIIIQPSSQTATAGEMAVADDTAILMVTATGSQPMSYQWYFNGNPLSGANSAELVFTNVQFTNAGTYYVVVSNSAGMVVSSNATLNVDNCFSAVDVSVVIDHSSSMSSQLPDGTVKLTDARIAATNFIKNLNFVDDQVAVFSFNNTVTTNRTLTNSQSFLLQGIGTVTNATGQTYMVGALQSAQAELVSTRHNVYSLPVMVFLSDGDPNDITNGDGSVNNVVTTNLVLNTATQIKAAGTHLFTIALGKDADTNFMAQLATSPSDTYYATNVSQLTNVYNLIAASICRGTNSVPTVSIISPVNQTLLARSNVVITVTNTSSVSSPPISWVEFFVNGTNSLGFAVSATNNLYQINWIPAVSGTDVLTALVMATNGSSSLSSPVSDYVRGLPTVTVTSPTNGQIFSLQSPMTSTNISISVTAVADGATITSVSFYQGTNLLGTDTSSPYGIVNGFTNGTYTLTARATDSAGNHGSSFPVQITVEPTNRPPSIYAGPDQTIYLSTNTLQLVGIVADDGLLLGSALSTTWTNLNGGTNVLFVNYNSPLTGVRFFATGTYMLRLSAGDGQYTVYSTNTVTVLPPNLAPVVDAGTNETIILPAQYSITNNPVYAASSQSIVSSEGKEFWLGFPENYSGGADLTLFISSETNTVVSIMVPTISFFTNCYVSAGKITDIEIPNYPYSIEAGYSDQIQPNGIHLVAQDDVSVYGLSHEPFTSDAYCGLPENALGTNYIVLAWPAGYDDQYYFSGYDSELLIVGTKKNTSVTITPTADDISGNHTNGGSYTIQLNEGETYQLQSAWGDLSGTTITSTSPVAVFGGNSLAFIPDGESYGDMVVEQIPAKNSWGRIFFTVPLIRNIPSDVFQVIAAEDGTTIYTNGNHLVTDLSAGQSFQFISSQPCEVTADKPILLAQYAVGSDYPTFRENDYSDAPGDPSMTLIPPIEQFLSTYTVSTPLFPTNEVNADGTQTAWTNYVNILVTNTGIASIYLDSTNLNSSLFTNIDTTGYAFAQIPLLSGSHHFNGNVPFGIYIYGLEFYDDAYSYPGGFSLSAIVNVNSITLAPQTATNEIYSTILLTAGVTNQDNQPVLGARVDFHVGGSNSLSGFAFTDPNGLAKFYYTGTNFGVDTITATIGTNTVTATNVWAWPTFTLHGRVTDDGLPLGITNITWSQIAGPSVATISDVHATNPIVTVTNNGYYVFQLEGNDTQLTNYAEVAVSVGRNQAPVVNAGPNQAVNGSSTTLNGSVADDGLPSGITNINWSEVSGPGTAVFGNATQAVTAVTFTTPGTYVLQLVGSDGQATVSSEITVTASINALPISCDQTNSGALTSTNLHSISLTNSYADYYQFTGSYNEQVTVTMDSTNFDTYLAIRNSQLQILAEDDDEVVDGEVVNTNSQIIYTLPADGTYIIEAASALPSQTGAYSLNLSCGSTGTNVSQIAVLTTNGQTVANHTTVNFDVTQVGLPIYQTLIITNEGIAPLSLGAISISGDFTLVSTPSSLITPNDSTTLIVQFNASTNGTRNGVLTFVNNDSSNNPFTLNLVGTANLAGLPPSISIVSPTNNSIFPLDTVIPITAVATSTDTVTTVNFYASGSGGNLLLGSETTTTNNFYNIDWFGLYPGNYSLTAVAIDDAGRVGYSVPVNVQITSDVNHPPVAVNDQVTVLANSTNNPIYPLTNDSDPNGDSFKITSLASDTTTSDSAITTDNGGSATIINNGQNILYTPPHGVHGGDGFYYWITDGRGGTAEATVSISIYATDKPSVSLAPVAGITNAGALDPLVAMVSPYENIARVDFYQGTTLLGTMTNGVDGAYTLNWTAVFNPCGCPFTAQATDIFGQVNTSPETNITVTTDGLHGSLIASVDSFADAKSTNDFISTNTTVIRDGLFTLYGQAGHTLNSNVIWQLGVYLPDETTLVRNLTPVFTTNTSLILLTNCDLTTLANGPYDFKLTVTGGYQMTSVDVPFILESNLKLGQFSFSQQDLVIPVNGIPLTVTRTYNSINPDKGDFGYGWTYTLADMNVDLGETREDVEDVQGGDDDDDLPGGNFSMLVSGGRNVTLTLPNGQRTTFYYQPVQIDNGHYQPAWQSAPGITAHLGVQGNPIINLDLSGQNPPTWTEADNYSQDVPYDNFDFKGFVLTNQDGTLYYIDRPDMGSHSSGGDWLAETYGKPYLAKIVQRSGDTITINPSSIVHTYTNGATNQIVFQRNADGLITAISDPNGLDSSGDPTGPPAVKYEYDSYDNLMNVERLTDRTANDGNGAYVTNSFTYENPNFPHYITSIENGDGVPVAQNFYDDSGRLIAVQNANGNTTRYIHNITNNTELVIDPLGNTNTFVYDSRGNVILETNALGQATANSYDDNNNLLSTTDPLGHTTSYAYDVNGNRTAATNALGQATHFNFDNYGNLLSKTDALNNAISFGYDSAGRRTQVTNAMGNPTTFSHDNFGRPNAVTNAFGQLRATAGSDSSGNLQFVSQAGGLQMNFGHDLNGNTTNTSFTWVNPNNSNQSNTLSTITELDAANRVTRVTDPDGNSRTTAYDLAGRVSQNVDRMGNTNSYTYDPAGNLVQTTYADGSVTRSVYDADQRMIYSDDRHLPGVAANGTHTIYDPLGRVVRTERLANVQIDGGVLTSAGAVLSASGTAYDAAGRVLATTNALGYVTQYEYDAVGRQTAVIDALTNRTDYAYDANGQLRFMTNALGAVTEYQYDAKGRRIKTIFPDGSYTTNSYNAIGQLVFGKDQLGLETDYQYDSLGRMTNIILPSVFNPEGGTNANPQFGYQYDSYGNLLDIRDSKGRETKFTYDALGELISRTLPLLQTNFNAYNALGQLAYSVDFKGQSNVVVYDSLGRVATNYLYAAGATTPGQTNIFLYDANGRLYQTIRPEGVTTFQYNLDGQMTNMVSPEGWISYEYDPAMNYLTRAYTMNSDVRYGYDALNRLNAVTVMERDGVALTTPEVTTNDYTALGSLQDVYYPSGVYAAYQYDVMNRLTNLIYQLGTINLATYSYQADAAGRRTNAVEILRQENGSYLTNTLAWQYDNLNRLTNEALICSVSSAGYTNSYAYDLAGNRLGKVHVGNSLETITYQYNQNDELTNETSSVNPTVAYLYDANGSLTNKTAGTTVNRYAYNLENKLAAMVVNGTTNATYQYDNQGVRVSATVGGNTTYYLIDANNPTGYPQIMEELPTVGGTPSRSYTIGNEVLAQSVSGVPSYFLPDGHGNNRQLTSASGTISSHYNYDAYGVVQSGISSTTAEAAPTTKLYCGEPYDAGLQMYNLWARYYLPGSGVFNQRDALDGVASDPLSLHRYAYCRNNPVNMSDPSGNQGEIDVLMAASIGASLDAVYLGAVAIGGYNAAAKVTEIGASFNSTIDAACRDASPGVDTATIIVHGVGPEHTNGWSKPFQLKLTAPRNAQVGGESLNHDFYEFDWGGFSINNDVPLTLYPIKSVHEMALVQLQMEEMLVSMNGYANIDIISHSWGTTLAYELQQTSGIETHNWVTMGSVLKKSTPKPVEVTGNWINFSSPNDPAYHAALYPPFPDNILSLSSLGPNVHSDPNVNFPFVFTMGHWGVPEHSAYWDNDTVATDLRLLLQ